MRSLYSIIKDIENEPDKQVQTKCQHSNLDRVDRYTREQLFGPWERMHGVVDMSSAICGKCRKPFSGPGQYCGECKPSHAKQRGEKKTRNRIYGTARWRALAKAQLRKEPLCRRCKSMGIVKAAQVADHIVELDDGGAAYDPANLQSLCVSCNTRKGARSARRRERG